MPLSAIELQDLEASCRRVFDELDRCAGYPQWGESPVAGDFRRLIALVTHATNLAEAEKDEASKAAFLDFRGSLSDLSRGGLTLAECLRFAYDSPDEFEAALRIARERATALRSPALGTRADEAEDPMTSEAAADQPDGNGFVSNPSDPTAYMGVAEITRQTWGMSLTTKGIDRILLKHPEIRRWKPSTKRKSVHIRDLLAYLDQNRPGDDPKAIKDRTKILREFKSHG